MYPQQNFFEKLKLLLQPVPTFGPQDRSTIARANFYATRQLLQLPLMSKEKFNWITSFPVQEPRILFAYKAIYFKTSRTLL